MIFFIFSFFIYFFNSYNILLFYPYIHLFIYLVDHLWFFGVAPQLEWQVVFTLSTGTIWGSSIFRTKRIDFIKNALCLRPNLSCRKQKTNPPKIRTSLQISCMFPPAPLGIAPDACFLKSGFSGSRSSGVIPGGSGGENTNVIWRDVPIFGGFVFCFLQLGEPKKTSFFLVAKYLGGENHRYVLIFRV